MNEALPWLILSATVVNLVLIVIVTGPGVEVFRGRREGGARRTAHEPGGGPECRAGAA